MRLPLAFLLLASLSLPAVAQAGLLSTTRMTCAQATNLVVRSGAVVLSTGRYTYARYVRHVSLCQPGDDTELVVVPTLDSPQCPLSICRLRPRRTGG